MTCHKAAVEVIFVSINYAVICETDEPKKEKKKSGGVILNHRQKTEAADLLDT